MEFFPENLGEASDEHGESFHQDGKAVPRQVHLKYFDRLLVDTEEGRT